MKCTRCGTPIADEYSACPSCGLPRFQQHAAPPAPPRAPGAAPTNPFAALRAPSTGVPNYILFALITTICGCMPLGIVAIVFAIQSTSKASSGDLAGAREAASRAKLFCILAVAVQVLMIVLWGGGALVQAFKSATS
jgi:hypothetical protein